MRLVGGMIKSILTILLFCHVLLLAEAPGRVVILGFDGVDPKLTRQWLAAGQLPHLARLSGQGEFTNVATTNPAESPVAWTTFATGKNPGKHNIFGFLKRDPIAYRPQLATVAIERRPLLGGNWGKAGLSLAMALVAGLLGLVLLRLGRRVWYRQRSQPAARIARSLAFAIAGLPLGIGCAYLLFVCLPDELPRATPCKDGESFWTIAGRAGVTTVVLGAPMAFPAEEVPGGRLLCGLGVPDLSGTNGLWFHYSIASSGITPTETGGWKIEFRDFERARTKADRAGLLTESVKVQPRREYSFQLVAEEDPKLALAGLRIEIERRLNEIAESNGLKVEKVGVGQLLRLLGERELLSQEQRSVLADMVGLLNGAVHGGDIDERAAGWALDIGPRLLNTLEMKIKSKLN